MRKRITLQPIKNFQKHCEIKDSGCWEWTGKIDKITGYGHFSVRISRQSIKTFLAHRFSYLFHKGEIPPGLHLDHKCRNRKCVNPEHLEPITPRTHLLNGFSPAGVNARKTHCINGHEFAGENLYVDPSGHRGCKICQNIRNKKCIDSRVSHRKKPFA